MDNFFDWLDKQLDQRGWLRSDLAKRANISQSGLSMAYSGKRGLGPEMLEAIAVALKLPTETVFRAAGLLTTPPEEDPIIAEITHLARNLPPEDVQDLIDMARLKIHRYERILSMVKKP